MGAGRPTDPEEEEHETAPKKCKHTTKKSQSLIEIWEAAENVVQSMKMVTDVLNLEVVAAEM